MAAKKPDQIAQTDAPAVEDALSIESYVSALADFVSRCETPMTVAIQGDWGSGKTSMMNMVSAKLSTRRCRVVNFNTWQYAQFNMGDDLVLALMEHLIDSVSRGEERDDYAVRARRTWLRAGIHALIRGAANTAVDELAKAVPYGTTGIKIARGAVQEANETVTKSETEQEFHAQFRGRTAIIDELRDDLQTYIQVALDALANAGDGGVAGDGSEQMRLVVMIDDLDRLPPQRAVEVMEALKVFLDVKRCVYVLAIDFDVVKQGVRSKFGSDFDERKAIAFFDKIIQVPFHMPVNAYSIRGFLLNALHLEETDTKSGDDPNAAWVDLAQSSIGNNPRALKRLANTFELLRGLRVTDAEHPSESAPEFERQLFAALCMQTAFPLYYQAFTADLLPLLRTGAEDQDQQLVAFFESQAELLTGRTEDESAAIDSDEREKWLKARGMTARDGRDFERFLDKFQKEFSGKETEFDAEALDHAIRRAAVTSVGNAEQKTEDQGKIMYGIDNVLDRVREGGRTSEQSFRSLKRLVDELKLLLPADKFDIGLSSNGGQVQCYVDAKQHTRGTFCEIGLGKRGIAVKFGRDTYQPAETLAGWRQEVERYFDLGQGSTGNFQIYVKSIPDLSGDGLKVLATCLRESHALTREHFFHD